MSELRYDTIILGSGLAGTVLAAILAKAGHDVLLVERGSHPRFAIGESMLPQSAMWMWILGQRFDLPELLTLSDTAAISEAVSPSCGQKKVIGFVYHQEGEDQDPSQAHQLIPPQVPLFSESHLFREDVDLYMLEAAKGYGVTYRDRTEMVGFHLGDDEVWIDTRSEDGGDETERTTERFRGRFLVDASGFRSPIAKELSLREEPTRLRTRSRSIFNHFDGLLPYDETIPPEHLPGLSRRWHDGTLHHVFDGGWFWIIPFGNHEGSDNRLASIGVTLDLDKHPRPSGLTPEEEFRAIARRFPSVERHLENVEPVRHWIGTDRLQYSSNRAVGDRFVLLSHAYGFVDPLYSQGLVSTFELIHALAARLLPALEDDDLTAVRFADLDRLQRAQLDANDLMVSCSYRAMAAFPLWNAWIQLWLASVLMGDTWIFRSCLHHLAAGEEAFAHLEGPERPVAKAPFADRLQALIERGEELLGRFEAGELTAEAAAAGIRQGLAEADWLPQSVYRWGGEDARHLDLVPERMMGFVGWGKGPESPAWLRDGLFDFEMPGPPPGAPMSEDAEVAVTA